VNAVICRSHGLAKLSIVLSALLVAQTAHSESLVGVVSKVADGDTLTLMNEKNERVRVRLTEIDAPERGQPYNQVSRRSLVDMCLHQTVTVEAKSVDKYGRTLGRVRCGAFDANAEQVRRGLAWAYVRYLTDPAISAAQDEAKKLGVGLWQGTDPIAPWNYRAAKRVAAKP
jgi:endonuclease YncB( thermonuclease family)